MYLLDTSVVSAVRRPDRAPKVEHWLREQTEECAPPHPPRRFPHGHRPQASWSGSAPAGGSSRRSSSRRSPVSRPSFGSPAPRTTRKVSRGERESKLLHETLDRSMPADSTPCCAASHGPECRAPIRSTHGSFAGPRSSTGRRCSICCPRSGAKKNVWSARSNRRGRSATRRTERGPTAKNGYTDSALKIPDRSSEEIGLVADLFQRQNPHRQGVPGVIARQLEARFRRSRPMTGISSPVRVSRIATERITIVP